MPQVYSSLFSMFHVYKTPSVNAGYRNFSNHALIYPLLAVFNACFQQLKQDLLNFVEDGVLASVAQTVARNHDTHTAHTKARIKACKKWIESDHPFSMDQDTLANLIVAVSATSNNKGSLPYTDDHPPLTLKGLAHTTMLIAKSSSTSVSFPFISRSPTIPLLRVAYFIAVTHLSSLTEAPRVGMIANAISIVVNELKLHNFPAPRPRNPGARGPPNMKSVYNSWIALDNFRAESAAIAHTLVHQSNNPQSITALTVRDSDIVSDTGEWLIAGISLNDMPKYINKTVTPSDFILSFASIDTYNNKESKGYYVYQHYVWLFSIINLKNPVHRLILWTARIFASMGPLLAPDSKFPQPLCASQDDFINATKATPLLEPPGRKGVKAVAPIVILFTGMALGLLYPNSPISKHLTSGSSKESLGEPWTSKHGKPSFYVHPYTPSLFTNISILPYNRSQTHHR